jgi:hypothetical protein
MRPLGGTFKAKSTAKKQIPVKIIAATIQRRCVAGNIRHLQEHADNQKHVPTRFCAHKNLIGAQEYSCGHGKPEPPKQIEPELVPEKNNTDA